MSLYKTTSPMVIRIYLILLFLCLLANLTIVNEKYHKGFSILSFLVMLIPWIYLGIISAKRLFFVKLLVGFGSLVFIFLLLFRTVRDSLPPPQISSKEIVGYSHYYGYPFLIDTVFFFMFLSYPVIFFMYMYRKYVKK